MKKIIIFLITLLVTMTYIPTETGAKSSIFAIEPKFDDARSFKEGLAAIELDGKWGFIDKKGKIVIKPKYTEVGDFYNGLASFLKGGKIGFINKEGKVIVQPKYDNRFSFYRSNLAEVTLHGKEGLINKKGEEVLKPIYDSVYMSEDGIGYAFTEATRKYDIINQEGKIISEVQYDRVLPEMQEGLMAVNLGNKGGFIDKNYNLVIPFQEDRNYDNFYEGRAWFTNKYGKSGFIDKAGNTVIGPKYDRYVRSYFNEGYSVVRIGYKFGVVDKYGNEIVKPIYDWINKYHKGFAAVEVNGKWGAINTKGDLVIKPKYDKIYIDSGDDVVRAIKNDYVGLLNTKGKALTPFNKFEGIGPFYEGLATFAVGTIFSGVYEYGYIDTKGNIQLKAQFDEVYDFSEGLAAVQIGLKWGFIKNPLQNKK